MVGIVESCRSTDTLLRPGEKTPNLTKSNPPPLGGKKLNREVEIMQRLQHPHIIRLEGVFENQQTLMLVLEYARGTELFDAILQKKRYPEEEARPIFEQVARALAYLHSLNIVHRCVRVRVRVHACGLICFFNPTPVEAMKTRRQRLTSHLSINIHTPPTDTTGT